ncbi:hypothetical protein BDZ97DRAFT_1762683 [Flammula alnicola]|nr:hypothetical protein BDZ97DRAFT_1762683 [Flammula alnicola]
MEYTIFDFLLKTSCGQEGCQNSRCGKDDSIKKIPPTSSSTHNAPNLRLGTQGEGGRDSNMPGYLRCAVGLRIYEKARASGLNGKWIWKRYRPTKQVPLFGSCDLNTAQRNVEPTSLGRFKVQRKVPLDRATPNASWMTPNGYCWLADMVVAI